MATGIPSKNGRNHKQNTTSFRIEYEGKMPVEDIFKIQPANLNHIISVEGYPRNQLIYGDNLNVLRTLLNNENVAGKINLVYIDPPYSTGSSFESRNSNHAYHDLMEGAEYLEFLRQRLIFIREILSEAGSIYLHLDEKMAFPVKIIMDEIFGVKNFRNWITRKKCNPKTIHANNMVMLLILFFSIQKQIIMYGINLLTLGQKTRLKKNINTWKKEQEDYIKKVPIHAPGVRKGATGQPWRGVLPPPGKHWQYTPETLDEMDARGEIYWSSTGNPRRKVYLDNSQGISIQDIWLDFKDAHNQNIKITGYPTEKNSEMIKRIIMASSNLGDIVLDAFAGSGTTLTVAEELGRKWIGIDNSPLSIDTIIQRLANGSEVMGDFVNDKNDGCKYKQINLIDVSRILKTGLDLYIEESESLALISDQIIKNWNSKLNYLTSFA